MGFKYDVFISYKHSELDMAVAEFLQKNLERFPIPSGIKKKTGKKKINRVFRDKEELSVGIDLNAEIEEQISQSEYLVVICSPDSKKSPWVQREIELFLKHRTGKCILPILISGEPEDAFPDILKDMGEPLAADFRAEDKKAVIRKAKEELPRLVAPILHCSYDELVQRGKVYKMKKLSAVACVAAAIAVCFGAVTISKNIDIQKNYEEKQVNQSRYLASLSEELLENGNREEAILVALEALPKYWEKDSRPFVAEARAALEKSLMLYRDAYQFEVDKRLDHRANVKSWDWDEEGKRLLSTDVDGWVYVWNLEDYTLCYEKQYKEPMAVFRNDNSIIIYDENAFSCVDYKAGKTQWKADSLSMYNSWEYNAATDMLYFIERYASVDIDYITKEIKSIQDKKHGVYAVDCSTGKTSHFYAKEFYDVVGTDGNQTVYLKTSEDGKNIALACAKETTNSNAEYQVLVYNSDKKSVVMKTSAEKGVLCDLMWNGNTFVCVSIENTGDITGSLAEESMFYVKQWSTASDKAMWSFKRPCLNRDCHVIINSYIGDFDGKKTPLWSIICNNVQVTLGQGNGKLYSHTEERIQIMNTMSDKEDTSLFWYLLEDGTVSLNSFSGSLAYKPTYTAYTYSIGDSIKSGALGNMREMYVAQDGFIYCYSRKVTDKGIQIDEDGAWTYSEISKNGKYVLTTHYENGVKVYNADNGSLCFSHRDVAIDTVSNTEAHFVAENNVVFLNKNKDKLCIYDLLTETKKEFDITEYSNGKPANSLYIPENGNNAYVTYQKQTYKPDYSYTTDYCINIVDCNSCELTDTITYKTSKSTDKSDGISLSSIHEAVNGDYVVLVQSNLNEEVFVSIWDKNAGGFRNCQALKQEYIEQKKYNNMFDESDGWISNNGNLMALYDGKSRLCVYDIVNDKILSSVNVDGIGSDSVYFSPDDEYLVFQDGNFRLCIVEWENGEYIQRDLEMSGKGYLSFSQDGKQLFIRVRPNIVTSDTTHIYTLEDNNTWKEKTNISGCNTTNGDIFVYKLITGTKIDRIYSLEELIDEARQQLNGRELTETEKKKYLID